MDHKIYFAVLPLIFYLGFFKQFVLLTFFFCFLLGFYFYFKDQELRKDGKSSEDLELLRKEFTELKNKTNGLSLAIGIKK